MIGSRCPRCQESLFKPLFLYGEEVLRGAPPKVFETGDSDSPIHGESEGTARRTVSKDAVNAKIVSVSGGNCRRGGFSAINRRR